MTTTACSRTITTAPGDKCTVGTRRVNPAGNAEGIIYTSKIASIVGGVKALIPVNVDVIRASEDQCSSHEIRIGIRIGQQDRTVQAVTGDVIGIGIQGPVPD